MDDEGYGKIKWVSLRDAKFAIACKEHKDDPPMELNIRRTGPVPRCGKCYSREDPPVARKDEELLEEHLQSTLKQLLDHAKTSAVELRIEFEDKAIKERNR